MTVAALSPILGVASQEVADIERPGLDWSGPLSSPHLHRLTRADAHTLTADQSATSPGAHLPAVGAAMSEIVPEALVPDVWRCEAARCPNCAALWHSEPRGLCETSCLNQPIVPRLRMPLLWEGDCA